MTDREWLRTFARQPSAQTFQFLLARYLGFVHSAAWRQTCEPARAVEVTRAVFLALSYKARHLPHKTVLAGWLFRATRCAGVKLVGRVKRRKPSDAPLAPSGAEFNEALDRLP